MIIKAGTILIIEAGEYDDFNYKGPYRVLKDFDQWAVAEAFDADERKNPEMSWWFMYGTETPDPERFVPWLKKHGYIEYAAHVAWHIGSHGCFEPKSDP